MNTWWCAIDKQWSSYAELKQRRVVAQGWPRIGDLRPLLPLVPDEKQRFLESVQKLGDRSYSQLERWVERDRELRRGPSILWNLINLQAGDLVVGLEGRSLCGVCQLKVAGVHSYEFDENFHYAQTVGNGVDWVDWQPDEISSRVVYGESIKRLVS